MARECHKCPYQGRTDDSARTACLACIGPAEESGKGIRRVCIDALPAADELIEKERLDVYHDQETTTTFDPDVEDALRIILAKYMALDPVDRLIMDLIYHGEDMAGAARRLGEIGQRVRDVSKQAVHKRVRALARTNPEMFAAIRSMIRDGAGGAVKKIDRHPQMEFTL